MHLSRPNTLRFGGLLALGLGFASLLAPLQAAEPVKFLELENEVVCRVNTAVISKRDVEIRMINSGQAMLNLFMFRERLKSEDQWNEENQERFNEIYIPAFRDELRNAIKEKLMLANAKAERMEVSKVAFEKRYQRIIDQYRQQGLINKPGFKLEEIKERLKETMLLEEFRDQFISVFDMPKKPDIVKYYNEHLNEFQRGPGVKVRQIRVDSIKINPLGKEERVPDALGKAERLREDIVKYSADFAQTARDHSDDTAEVKANGGLIASSTGDSFITMDGRSAAFVKAIESLKPGGISRVFAYGEHSFAFVMLEARREAGPKPLDDALYEEINKKLIGTRIQRKENEWFHKAVQENLIMGIQEGRESKMPMSFFFPDDPAAIEADRLAIEAKKAEAKPVRNESSESGR